MAERSDVSEHLTPLDNAASGEPNQDREQSFERRLERRVSGPYNLIFKPIVGPVIAVPLLVTLSPVLTVIALAIIVDTGLPVFYRGERGGFRGKPFRIYKFRTMVRNADQIGGGTTALADPRITRVGRLLRKTKLDEFPQLLNIIRSEMCFVGPRPELLQYTRQYAGLETYISKVRPGITDFSSIEYINLDEVVGAGDADAAYERDVLQRKNQLRIHYVEQMSPLTDLRLFVITVVRAVKGVLRHIFKGGGSHGDN
ncbi:sugar transferase [Raineyella antarctica]|uniref:sugar transferase n=1 Tax=Raineyella antarctica TaxID=1577474 RepID=UPI001C319F3D|nr:sugar transferase [Raineyella antarctica]